MAARVIDGGDKLRAALDQIARSVGRGGTLSVGFLENSTYPDGASTAMVAAVQNFGAPAVGVPPRPFFSNMVAERSPEWPAEVSTQLRLTDYDVSTTMRRMGELIRGQLQQSIRDTNDPPLSPVTLMVRQIIGPRGTATFADVQEARRRVAAGETASGVSTKPLVWTSHLLNSAAYEYEER
jgi:hypothetical protein